jgi:hypothetical protein
MAEKLSHEDFNFKANIERETYQIALGIYRERATSNGLGKDAAEQAFAGADAFVAVAQVRISALAALAPDPKPEIEINPDDLDEDPALCKPGFGVRSGEAPAPAAGVTGDTGPTPEQTVGHGVPAEPQTPVIADPAVIAPGVVQA